MGCGPTCKRGSARCRKLPQRPSQSHRLYPDANAFRAASQTASTAGCFSFASAEIA